MLASWAPSGAAPAALGFDAVDTLHFASVTVFDRPFLDALLVIECNFDGTLDDFLPVLAHHAGGLAALLDCRIGPPLRTRHAVVEAMRAAAVKPAAGHIGAVGLSRVEILQSQGLVDKARRYLATRQNQLSGLDAAAVAAALRRALAAECPQLHPRRTAGEFLAAAAPLGVAAALLLALLAALLWFCVAERTVTPLVALAAMAGAAAYLFLRAERREPVRTRPSAGDDEAARNENRPGVAQNHFSSLAPLKTGPMRWVSLRIFMWLLGKIARAFYIKGKLGGIPSIHFAHWTVVDEGSSLIFLSNYGGTWESYLDDFIQKAADGLTGVWSHCQGFPASHRLTKGGARDERAFKRYARDSQAAEAIWFTAYPRLTTRRINNNRAIMEGLAGVSKEPPERWLARI